MFEKFGGHHQEDHEEAAGRQVTPAHLGRQMSPQHRREKYIIPRILQEMEATCAALRMDYPPRDLRPSVRGG